MQGMFNSLINFQGSGTMQPKSKTKGHAPKDIHGGQKFVVKVQLPMTQLAAGALIYDEQRSFQQQVRLWVLNVESARVTLLPYPMHGAGGCRWRRAEPLNPVLAGGWYRPCPYRSRWSPWYALSTNGEA